jgi:hypothetical protein
VVANHAQLCTADHGIPLRYLDFRIATKEVPVFVLQIAKRIIPVVANRCTFKVGLSRVYFLL